MLRSPKPLGERWQLYLESVYLGSNPWQCFPSCFPVKKPWHEKAPLEGGARAGDQHRPSPGLCGHWAGIFAPASLELSLHKAAGARGWKLGKKKLKNLRSLWIVKFACSWHNMNFLFWIEIDSVNCDRVPGKFQLCQVGADQSVWNGNPQCLCLDIEHFHQGPSCKKLKVFKKNPEVNKNHSTGKSELMEISLKLHKFLY